MGLGNKNMTWTGANHSSYLPNRDDARVLEETFNHREWLYRELGWRGDSRYSGRIC